MAKFLVEVERFERRFKCGDLDGCGYDGCGLPNGQICPELAAKMPEVVELTAQKVEEFLTNKDGWVAHQNKPLFFVGLKITRVKQLEFFDPSDGAQYTE